MTQRKGLRGILALLCAMTLLIGAIGPAWATEAAPLTDGGTQEVTPAPDGNTPAPNGETPPPAPQTKPVITSWSWADPNGYLEEGVLLLSEKQVDYNGVTSYLPETITAQVDGQAAPVTVDVVNWHCEEFTGLVSSGEFTFKAQIASDYTLKDGVPALEVKVKFQQPVTDDTGDTTENTPAPAAPTPPAADVVTVESWNWVDSMQALSDDGKLHLKEEITDANLPEIQKLLPQSIQAGENIISLTWTYSKETKIFTADLPKGYTLAEGAAPLTVAVVVEQVTMLPVDSNSVYVGGVALTYNGTDIYTTTDSSGNVITDGATADNYNIKWDGSTLTLRNAAIKKELNDSSSSISGSAIGVINQSGDAGLTVQLEGNNKIEGVSGGIYVLSSEGGAALNIKGGGTLIVNSSSDTIQVIGSNGNAALSIVNAKVTATSSNDNGVTVQSGSSKTSSASLTVDGGSLTATAPADKVSGINLLTGAGTPTVTVSNNAIVRANGSAGGITSNSSTEVHTAAGTGESGGIVWNGKNGTVYGDVTLQEDLTINQGETLTVGKDASLTVPDGKTLTNDGTITLESGGKLEGTTTGNGTLKIAPTITTQPQDVEVKENETATFTVKVTGTEPLSYQWQQSTDKGSSWTNIDSATSDTYTTGKTTMDMSGTQYRCVVKNSIDEVTSDAATLTVTTPTVPVTGVALDHTELSLFTGDSAALTATVKPDDAANKKVTWSSSESGVASVDGNGKVTALKAGTTTITVTTEDGSKTATCKVTVSDKTYGISVDTEVDFGTAYSNYTAKAKTVTIKNTGNQPVTLNQPASTNSFAVGVISNTELPAGGTVTFTVQPKPGLTAGTYGETVKVIGTSGQTSVNASVSAKFTVRKELQVKLTAANFTTTYNGSAVFPEAIHKTATCDGQAVSGTWSFVGGNPKNAGTYKDIELKFTPKDTEKYAAASIKLDVVIKKAPLKVSVKLSKTKIAVNSTLPTVSLSYSGLMGNDKMQPKVEPKFEGMPSGKKTGTYTISLKNVDEVKKAINDLAVSKNYDITYVTSAKLSVVSGNNPLTADTSNIQLWTAIMIISGIGLIVVLVVMVVLNKKSKRRRPRYRRTPPKQEEE